MMRTRLMAVLATVLLGAGLAACGQDARPAAATTPGVQPDGHYQVGTLPDADAQAALRAAVETLPAAVSFDYRSLDRSLSKATEGMTSQFAEEFRRIFDKTTRAKALREKTIQSSLVRGAGVVGSVTEDRVTCLVYLNQVLVASTLKDADGPLKVIQNRVRVQMAKVDGAWKVDGLEPF